MQFQYEYFSSKELGLPPDVWRRFAQTQPPQVCEKNQMIYWQGEVASQFYYIQEGKVKTFISSDDGDEKILTVYQAGDILGEASFFDEMPRVSSARALVRSKIISISRQMVMEHFAADPTLALSMLKYLARTVRMLSSHVDNMTFLQADKRIARLLLKLRDNGNIICCTHEEIGFSVGVSRVTVSRILNDFVRRGWISTQYRIITILKETDLSRFAYS